MRSRHYFLGFLYSLLLSPAAYADVSFGSVTPNVNDAYIHSQSYLQNPFVGLSSGGGTQYVSESEMASHSLMRKLFRDGTWAAQGFAGLVQNNGARMNTALAGTLFGQTGQLAGFSLGGTFVVANPVLTPMQNPASNSPQAVATLTSDQQFTPTEAYIEYQHSNIVQVDAGWIGINNSPFLTNNYYENQSVAANYQGFAVNVNPLSGWLVTALGFNAAQYAGQSGFTGVTMYNAGSNFGIPPAYQFSDNSSGTLALGVSYYTPDNNYNFRVWGYNFKDYADLVYADNTLKLPVNEKTSFTLAAQGGMERGSSIRTFGTNADLGDVNSNFVGLQAGFNYDWFGISFGYNNMWGPADAFGNGGLISPYTYNENVDPLYTNSWMTGLVTKGSAGQGFIIAPSFSFLDDHLKITPSATMILPSNARADQEYDFIAAYDIPEVKGLRTYGVFGYETLPTVGTNTVGQVVQGGAAWTIWYMTSYTY